MGTRTVAFCDGCQKIDNGNEPLFRLSIEPYNSFDRDDYDEYDLCIECRDRIFRNLALPKSIIPTPVALVSNSILPEAYEAKYDVSLDEPHPEIDLLAWLEWFIKHPFMTDGGIETRADQLRKPKNTYKAILATVIDKLKAGVLPSEGEKTVMLLLARVFCEWRVAQNDPNCKLKVCYVS